MEIVGKGNGSDVLTQVPSPPAHLDAKEKKHYREIGKTLITAGVLKSVHLMALEVLATNRALWIFAVKEIAKKNRKKYGEGYVQTYTTGATNITTELAMKGRAEKLMLENLALFGMDPISEKKLKGGLTNPNQGDLFEGFMNQKKAK